MHTNIGLARTHAGGPTQEEEGTQQNTDVLCLSPDEIVIWSGHCVTCHMRIQRSDSAADEEYNKCVATGHAPEFAYLYSLRMPRNSPEQSVLLQ